MTRCIALLVASLTSCAGYKRVELPKPPNADAPLSVRVQAFRDLSIQNGQQTTYLRNGVPQSTSLDFVLLGDGTRVEDPRDLASLVDVTSPTARYLAKLEEQMAAAKTGFLITAISALASVGLAVGVGIPVALSTPSCDRYGCNPGNPGVTIGGIIAGGFGFLAVVGAPAFLGYFGSRAGSGDADDRVSAFMTYNRSLAQKLGLDEASTTHSAEKPAEPAAPRQSGAGQLGESSGAQVEVESIVEGYPYYGLPGNTCSGGKTFVIAKLVGPWAGLAVGTRIVLRLESPALQTAKAGTTVRLLGLQRAGKGEDGTPVLCGKGVPIAEKDFTVRQFLLPAGSPAPPT